MDSFQMNRDGISPESARALLGMRRFATRYWPLMTRPSRRAPVASSRETRSYHRNLYALCRFAMNGFSSLGATHSHWSAYVDQRDHYPEDAAAQKRMAVMQWLEQIRPSWVVDFGCNTGEFTRIARNVGASVVAIDIDHGSVQDLYRASPNDTAVFPLVANLDDFASGRGFGGIEFPGLAARLRELGDVTMMLALIHHLAISHAVPYEDIASLAHSLTKRMLIVELLHEDDPWVARLCAQRKRGPSEFSLASQRTAFERWFTPISEVAIGATRRSLVLMERR